MSEDNPYIKERKYYTKILRKTMENDYSQLDLLYLLMDKIHEDYDKGKLDLLETIDQEIILCKEIGIIHDRIRKRLHL